METKHKVQSAEAQAMRELRLKMLGISAQEIGVKASADFPRVFGVVWDWSLGDSVVTIVSLCTGDASLYTTATFGVIGGIGHAPV